MTMYPPLENLAPPPRRVPMSVRAAAMNGFKFKAGTVIFAVGMTFYLYMALPLSWLEIAFWLCKPLTSTHATIISVQPTRWVMSAKSGGAIGTGGSRVFRFRYQFSDARSTMRQGLSYDHPVLIVPKPGDQINVEFWPTWPSVNRAVGKRASPLTFVFNTAAAIPLVGLLLLVSAVRDGLRRIRLLTGGEVAEARIRSFRINPDNPKMKDAYTVDVEFEFQTRPGQRVSVKQRVVDRVTEVLDRVRRIGDKAEIPVVYQSKDPEAAALLESLPGGPTVGPDGCWQGAGATPLVVFALFALAHMAYIGMAIFIIRGESAR